MRDAHATTLVSCRGQLEASISPPRLASPGDSGHIVKAAAAGAKFSLVVPGSAETSADKKLSKAL